MAEAICIMVGVPADHCDEGEKEQGEYQDHLTAGKPELGFTVGFDRQDIENTVEKVSIPGVMK